MVQGTKKMMPADLGARFQGEPQGLDSVAQEEAVAQRAGMANQVGSWILAVVERGCFHRDNCQVSSTVRNGEPRRM